MPDSDPTNLEQLLDRMPFMEVVPFIANVAGLVLTVFGLALIACDGLLVLIGFSLVVLSIGMAAFSLI